MRLIKNNIFFTCATWSPAALIFYSLALVFCLDTFVWAGGKTSIFRFLKEAHSPRQVSLASINTFFSPDAFSSLQNPSAMTLASNKEISFSGGSRLTAIGGATGGIAGILNLKKGERIRTAGFNFIYDGSIQEKTIAPLSSDRYDFVSEGSFATYSFAAGGYYSMNLPRETSPSEYGYGSGYYGGRTYFGIGGKLVVEKLYERSYPGVAFDAALLEESDQTTAFSIGVKNVGFNFASEESYPLPASGFLTILKKYRVLAFAIDAEYDAQSYGDIKLGVETFLAKGFALRLGFRHPFSEYDTGDFILSRISAGFGISFNKGKLIFDYAWRPMGDLGSTHIVALRSNL